MCGENVVQNTFILKEINIYDISALDPPHNERHQNSPVKTAEGNCSW